MSQLLVSDFIHRVSDIVTGFLAIIPQIIYFLYASMASLLDVAQIIFRKLIGLDVYYLKDANGDYISKSGDILKEFVEGILGINNSYSALATVFWSLIIFGVMVLVLTTIIAIIKAHYNYDAQKSTPFAIIKVSLKSLALMAITPVVILFSVYLSEIILQSLDKITESPTATNITKFYENDALGKIKKVSVNSNGEDVGEGGDVHATYYISYDMFGMSEWSNAATFSGKIFELISRDANRVRLGGYTAGQTVSNSNWDNCGIFYTTQEGDMQEIVASQIDCAFMNNLTLTNGHTVEFLNKKQASTAMVPSFNYGPSAIFAAGLINVTHFSKFNIGLVWYYYNLWVTNYIIGFMAVIACGTLMFSIMFGLMKRLIICVTLFVIQAPIIAISPLDGGNGFTQWKQKFISYFVAGYGAVVGMNLFFLLTPVIESMSFFNNIFFDKLFNLLVLACGLSMIKGFVPMLASFVGGADLAKEGTELKGSMGKLATGAAVKTLKTAALGTQIGRFMVTVGPYGTIYRARKNAASGGGGGSGGSGGSGGGGGGSGTAADLRLQAKRARAAERAAKRKVNIGKILNSKITRGFLRYMAIAPVSMDNEVNEDEIRNEMIVDPTTGATRKRTDAEVKQVVDQRKAQQGMEVLHMAGQSVGEILSRFGPELAQSTGIKAIVDKLAEAGAADQTKTVVQEAMKIGGFDPSFLESAKPGDLERARKYRNMATKKQLDKRSKNVKELELRNTREATANTEQFVRQVSALVQNLKRKV